MESIRRKLLSRDIFCTKTFYWHKALVGLKLLFRNLVWSCPAQGREAGSKLFVLFWCCLASSFLFVVFKFCQRLHNLRNGVPVGVMKELDLSTVPAAHILEKDAPPHGRGKMELICPSVPAFPHIFTSSTVLSSHFMTAWAGARHICFDLSPYYWAALFIPLEPNTFCSAFLQGTLEILLSSASSSHMCWSNQMKFSW